MHSKVTEIAESLNNLIQDEHIVRRFYADNDGSKRGLLDAAQYDLGLA